MTRCRCELPSSTSAADICVVKPLDENLILQPAGSHELLVTIDDGVIAGDGGRGVGELLAARQQPAVLLDLGLSDRTIEHSTRIQQLAECGLDSGGILRAIQARLRAERLSKQS